MGIVDLKALTKSYGGRPPALRDVTFEIPEGVTGLLGPNGAGKSTLIQCVLGLLPDFDGDATVLGRDARKDRLAIRTLVGFMPETDAYLPKMTGIQSVRYLGQLTGLPRNEALRRAHEVLYHVGLGEAIYRPVKEYSTGMRQRFKLATALVHDPELVFLDEPLSGMDPQGRMEMLALIRELAADHHKHVIWSSHILPDVQKAADAIVVLHHGRFRGTFELKDLALGEGKLRLEIEGESTAFAAALEASDIRLAPADAADEAEARASSRTAWIATLPSVTGAAAVLKAAHETGVRVRRLAPVVEDLEQVFRRILGETEED